MCTIFFEKWSWVHFYFFILSLKSATEGIVDWYNWGLISGFLSIWLLESKSSLHTAYIPSLSKWSRNKAQMSYIHLEKDSSGICFIWSHTCLKFKPTRYPPFQHSGKAWLILWRSLRICSRQRHPQTVWRAMTIMKYFLPLPVLLHMVQSQS